MNIDTIFEELIKGNGSVINTESINTINKTALVLYQNENLDKIQIESLKKIIMICNILYNRTDMVTLPVDDDFYDLLLEKYKKYDSNFQVGSAVIEFKNFKQRTMPIKKEPAICPISFIKQDEKDEIHQDMYDGIMRTGKPILNRYDFAINPIEFINEDITKRTHNTEHNHPSLVGTLDKCKFVFLKDAINAGVEKDPNIDVLERDFFMKHISDGIYDPNRIINIVAELKYDGISVEADCDIEVKSARTRGDTGIGQAADITPILKGYTFKQAGCMIGEKPIGVKFEAIMSKTNLETFNRLRNKNYKNCRTAIVGLFGASDAYLFRDLITLIPLALDRNDIPMITNRMEEIEFLNKVFVSHGEPLRYCYMSGTVTEILYLIKAFWDEAKFARNILDFMYDGIVISYIDEDIREKLGRSNNINKYSMAVKFEDEEKQTIFRGCTFEVGQHGQITPMIHYDPVSFLGTIHTKSTGSSLDRFNELQLKYGDYINVAYRNDVMPYVSRLDCEHNRNNPAGLFVFPTNCPVCGTTLIISDSDKTALCPNNECPGRVVKRMTNMFNKLNIKGFAESSFTALNKSHLYELMHTTKSEFIDKLGNADGNNIYNELQKLKSEPLKDYIIMGALGFTSIAHKKWQSILQQITVKDLIYLFTKFPVYEEIYPKLLSIIPNIGEKTLDTILKEFRFFTQDIEEILSWNNLIDSYGTIKGNKLQIRFTGIRNKQLSELLCNAGYDADDSSSVSKKTDILLVPYQGFNSSKVNKVSENCKIIPIDNFISNMKLYLGEDLSF